MILSCSISAQQTEEGLLMELAETKNVLERVSTFYLLQITTLLIALSLCLVLVLKYQGPLLKSFLYPEAFQKLRITDSDVCMNSIPEHNLHAPNNQLCNQVHITIPEHNLHAPNNQLCNQVHITQHLKDQYGPRTFFLEFPFFAKNMIIKSILNLWWHSKILKLFLGVIRGIFTKRLKRTRRLLYTVKYDFFQMTALHSKC